MVRNFRPVVRAEGGEGGEALGLSLLDPPSKDGAPRDYVKE